MNLITTASVSLCCLNSFAKGRLSQEVYCKESCAISSVISNKQYAGISTSAYVKNAHCSNPGPEIFESIKNLTSCALKDYAIDYSAGKQGDVRLTVVQVNCLNVL